MIKIAICDDEKLSCEGLRYILKEYNFNTEVEINIFTTGSEMMRSMNSNGGFDIVFLDIELGEESGIEYGKKLKEYNSSAILIFISGFLTYFRDMSECEPFAFIEKPFANEKDKIFSTLDRAIKRMNRLKNKIFSFEYKGEKYNVDLKDVLYFESRLRIIVIHTAKQELQFYGKLDEIQKEIEDVTDLFVRVNKSCYVNLNKIQKFTKTNVVVGKQTIPVSRKYTSEFMSKMYDFY